MSTPRTVRDRIKDEVTREILVVAREHLGQEGAAALSLRSIARELEMAPSALYRYFDSRDALLSALILGAYTSLADDAEAASVRAFKDGADVVTQWPAVPRAMRGWALQRPQEWGLIFGSPVPGYEAPTDTIGPYIRMTAALASPIIAAHDAGTLVLSVVATTDENTLAAAVQPVTDGLLPGLPPASVARTLEAFTTLVGIISLEIFGHWRNTVLTPDVLFEEVVANLALTIGLRP